MTTPKRGDVVTALIYLRGEVKALHKIGAGWRTVEAEIGSKWVRLRTPGGKKAKITRALFDEIYAGSAAARR